MKSTTLKILLSASLTSALLLTASCSRQDDKAEPSAKVLEGRDNLNTEMPADNHEDMRHDMHQTGADIKHGMVHARDEVMARTRETLDALSRKIDDLEARTADEKKKVKSDTQDLVKALKEERAKVAASLERAGEVSEENWHAFVGEAHGAIDKLEEGYNKVLESMKTEK